MLIMDVSDSRICYYKYLSIQLILQGNVSGIDQYVHHLYILGKVDKYLENQRNFDVLEMVVTRWKFHCRMKRTIEPEWDVKDPTVSSHISI